MLQASAALKAITGADQDDNAKAYDTYVPVGVEAPWAFFYGIGESADGVFKSSTPATNRNRWIIEGTAGPKATAKSLIDALMALCDGTALTMTNFKGTLQRVSPSTRRHNEETKKWTMGAEYLVNASPK